MKGDNVSWMILRLQVAIALMYKSAGCRAADDPKNVGESARLDLKSKAHKQTLSIPQSVLNLAGLKGPASLRPVVQAQPHTRLRLVHGAGVLRDNLFGR